MKLYVFDSCPYCVPVRAQLALTKLPFQLHYLQPGQLPAQLAQSIEQFTVPILQLARQGQRPLVLQESLEIIRYLDALAEQPQLNRYQLSAPVTQWLAAVKPTLDGLCYPRMLLLELPELTDPQVCEGFIHSRAQRLGCSLLSALDRTEAFTARLSEPLAQAQQLLDVAALLEERRAVNIDDLYAFAVLRNLSMVGELCWPERLVRYLELLAKRFAIALYAPVSRQQVIDSGWLA